VAAQIVLPSSTPDPAKALARAVKPCYSSTGISYLYFSTKGWCWSDPLAQMVSMGPPDALLRAA